MGVPGSPTPPAKRAAVCRGLTYLSDGHGAEDVEEDEGAVCEVLTHEVAVRQTLDQGEGCVWGQNPT